MSYPAIEQIKAALSYLASRCDGANAKDGKGFNGRDTNFGKSLASVVNAGGNLSQKQLESAHMMLNTYKKQLADAGLSLPTMEALATDLSASKSPKKVITTPASTKAASVPTVTNPNKILDVVDGKIIVSFDFSYAVLDDVKAVTPKGKFNPTTKKWEFQLSSLIEVASQLQPKGFILTDAARRAQNNLAALPVINQERLEVISRYLISDAPKWSVTPFKHQWQAVKFICSQSNLKAIVADDMGLGKSLSAIIAAKGIQHYYQCFEGIDVEILVVSPASLKQNWMIEARKIGLDISNNVYSYEGFTKLDNLTKGDRKFILICDEFHYCQSLTTKRTKQVLEVSKSSNCISLIGLTGTPLKNGRPSNLFPLLKAIDHPISRNRREYEVRYCDARSTAFCPWDISGASNLDELNDAIKDKLIRRTKEECLDLPEKIYTNVVCEGTKDAKSEYDSAFSKEVKSYKERVASREISGKSEAVVMLGILRRLSSLYKSYEAIRMAESLLEDNHPVVIFTQFVESAERIAAHFGVKALTGSTEVEKTINGVKVYPRQELVNDFQNGVTNVFVSTIGAGGVGITLTRSSHLIMVDLAWTYGDNTQATDRIHRIGQTRMVNIYTLFAKDVDYMVAARVNQKSEIVNAVLEGLNVDINEVRDMSLERMIEHLI